MLQRHREYTVESLFVNSITVLLTEDDYFKERLRRIIFLLSIYEASKKQILKAIINNGETNMAGKFHCRYFSYR